MTDRSTGRNNNAIEKSDTPGNSKVSCNYRLVRVNTIVDLLAGLRA
jgi:hypothetical protein